jgi:transcriptional regulator with XRE-family HTH domain
VAVEQTALARLLQQRREAKGYSRARVGQLVGIRPGTIEGWELGRVARPPIHDVLRLAHFLDINADELQGAVFADAGSTPAAAPAAESAAVEERRRGGSAIPLLDAAFTLFAWKEDSAAADALGTTPERVRAWRDGREQMQFSEYLALTALIGVAAAAAMKGDEARIADLSAAADALGVGLPNPD